MLRRSVLSRSLTVAAAALLLLSCGTRRMAQPSEKNAPVTVEPLISDDSIDENTRQRLAYFYKTAMTQHTAGNLAEAYDLLRHCLRINPKSAETYFSLYRYDGEINSKSMADEDIRRAERLSPGNRIYKEFLAALYLKENNFKDAIPLFENLSKQQPDRTDLLELLVQIYNKVGDYNNVIATLDRLNEADGEDESAVFAKMNAYSKLGKKKDEYLTLKRYVDKYPNDPNCQVLLGNWLMHYGTKKQALAILEKVLKQDSENLGAQLTMLDYYTENKSDSLADNLRVKLLCSEKTPVDTKVQMIRQVIGRNEAEGGDSTKVLALFDKILAGPQKTKDMLEVYAAYLDLKKMPEDSVMAVYNRILDMAPDYTAARLQVLRRLKIPENLDEIANYCKSGIEYTPSELSFYYFLGFSYIQKEKYDEAYDVFMKGLAQVADNSDPVLVTDMYEYVGNILYERGDTDGAYAAFDNALLWKEDNESVLNNYAYYLSENGGDLTKAEHMSYLTVKAEPTNSLYLDTYAWILFRQERYAEAQIYIDQAIKNDSTASAVLFGHGGDIYFKLGNVGEAVELWKKAREAGDDSAVLEQKIRRKTYIPEKGK